jgi:osmotically-inducible protein OsmY
MRARCLSSLSALTILLACLTGCAAYDAYRKCGLRGCPGDTQIDAQVRALLDQHPALRAPNHVYVQTLDGVVYLSGQVATGLQRATAESVAGAAPDVRRVVSTISLTYEGR